MTNGRQSHRDQDQPGQPKLDAADDLAGSGAVQQSSIPLSRGTGKGTHHKPQESLYRTGHYYLIPVGKPTDVQNIGAVGLYKAQHSTPQSSGAGAGDLDNASATTLSTPRMCRMSKLYD